MEKKTVKPNLIFHLHSSWLCQQLCEKLRHFVAGRHHVAGVAFEVAGTAPPANCSANASNWVQDFDMIMLFLGGWSLLQVVCWLIFVASTAGFEWLTSFHQWSEREKLELLNWNQDSDLEDFLFGLFEYGSSLCLSFFFFHSFTLT